jgi:hypothetical protein
METPIILQPPVVAQAAPARTINPQNIWMISTAGLALLLVGLGVYGKLKFDKLAKEKRFEEVKNRDLQKKLRLALQTISKMERNPDLIHSREFNLDYMRMRMDEEKFRFIIINQLKIKVKERISVALRAAPTGNSGVVGIAGSGGKHIDEMFDVEYKLNDTPKAQQRVLFRVQIKMTKLPTQATSVTVNQIVECLEQFMSPDAEDDNWQPVIQNRIASLRWDQKAKPTPLLVLEQSNDGANVTYRTKRMVER